MADFIGPVKKSGYKPPKRKLTWSELKNRLSHRMQVRLSYAIVSAIYAAVAGLILLVCVAIATPLFDSVFSGLFGETAPAFEAPLSSIYKGSDVADGEIISSQLETPLTNRHFASLNSDDLDINAPVYNGTSKRVLASGVAFDKTGAMPGENSNVYLKGYATSALSGIKNAEKGDEITLTTNYGYFRYKVTKTEVLSNEEATRRNVTIGRENLVIQVPYPFDILSDSRYETFCVYAEKVSGPSATAH